MDAEVRPLTARLGPLVGTLAVWGPGLLVMLADTDAGNVVTAAQAGAQWGYRLLPLVLGLIPMLYLVQELAVRLGVHTGRGFGELINVCFGPKWAFLAALSLVVAVLGALVTQFTGVAGIGELYGVSRGVTLPLASAALLLAVLTGSYRRVELLALFVGLFELAFFVVAWQAHPDFATLARQAVDLPIGDSGFLFLAAAIIGSVFNPWMIFYQQSAVVGKDLRPEHIGAARWDTALGAILTQFLTGAVLVAAAASFHAGGVRTSLDSIGEIGRAFAPFLGKETGLLIFSMGVLGASLAAAIVASLALCWGLGEIIGGQRESGRRSPTRRLFDTKWFYGVFAGCIIGSAALVYVAQNLVWLNIAAQAMNALMFPLMIGLLIALAARALREPFRLQGWRLQAMITLAVLISTLGFVGALAGLA